MISPDGQGRRLGDYSWGSPGQIADLARMPAIARAGLPWLRIDRTQDLRVRRQHGRPGVAAAARAPSPAARRRGGVRRGVGLRAAVPGVREAALQRALSARSRGAARTPAAGTGAVELGGSPRQRPLAFAERSPITYARAIAASCVPLQIWWSPADRVVVDQQRQSGKFFWKLRAMNPHAPISGYVGFWIHSHEMRASTRLPFALRRFGLLPPSTVTGHDGLHVVPAPQRRLRALASTSSRRRRRGRCAARST